MIRKLVVIGAIVTGVVVLMAGPASAHVEIEREGDVSSTGLVTASLTVPNEKTDAGTVKIALVFPDTPGLDTAEPGAVDGWTASVEKDDAGDVTQVVWTGGPLTGEDEVELPLEIGEIPEGVEAVDFKALQTYDDGDEVRWIDPTPASGEEPEHPAPVLLISGEASAHDDSDGHHDDGLSTGAIIAIVLGVVIVVALIVYFVRRSRQNKESSTV